MPSLTTALASEYQRLFDTCMIDSSRAKEVDAAMRRLEQGRMRYTVIEDKIQVPWFFTGIIHLLECSGDFKTHLHNGDPLSARTIRVPANRPQTGKPPFTWEESALDALRFKRLDQWMDWSIPGMLFKLEQYNGFGYRRAGINIPSPYLWSFSNHYNRGKFIKDNKYSPTAQSKQCGAAVLLRRIFERQMATVTTDRKTLIRQLGTEVRFNPTRYVAKVEELQHMLNLQGEFLKVDGKAGRHTADAYFRVTGQVLAGDPDATNRITWATETREASV